MECKQGHSIDATALMVNAALLTVYVLSVICMLLLELPGIAIMASGASSWYKDRACVIASDWLPAISES